jgi:hypothetical protein
MRTTLVALALIAVLVLVVATVFSAGNSSAVASEQPQYCGACHPDAHPDGWRTLHGRSVTADSSTWTACMGCHTTASCDQCHQGKY